MIYSSLLCVRESAGVSVEPAVWSDADGDIAAENKQLMR